MNILKKFYLAKKKYIANPSPPPSGMDKATILKKISSVPFWWHHIELGHGIITPGHQGSVDDPWASRKVLEMLCLPESLKGKTVLDIGGWDGYFGFEAEKLGASRTLVIDNFYRLEKEGKELDMGPKGFETAKEILSSNIEYKIIDVNDISPDNIGIFDISLFLGVFYHLKNPLHALEQIYSVTKEILIIETHYINKYGNVPVCQFYPEIKLNKDPTNWWGPNQACLEAMVRSVGFLSTEVVSKSKNRIVLKCYK